MRNRLAKGLLGVSLSLILLLTAVPALASGPGGSAYEMPPSSDNPDSIGTGEQQIKEVHQVTLITGDVVTVAVSGNGTKNFAIIPADPTKLGQHFLTLSEQGRTYIIPDSVDLNKLDKELFNIDYLVDEQYYQQPSLPLLVSYSPGLPAGEVQSLESAVKTLGEETKLIKEVATIATRLDYQDIAPAYGSLITQPKVGKIWLDKKYHAQLNESVPLIGAPSYWASGYNGTGVKIAILDTGIDVSHPALNDLDDNPATIDPKVIMNINFTDDTGPNDLYGHGTHVAGIAAGTKTGGNYTGVATGAWLWNIKVLNRYGYGYESWIINGVNFASLGGDGMIGTGDEADIISMSLGGGVSDGTDPLSQAVNVAVDRGVVVVVAAGNSGSGMYTVSSPGAAEKVITVGASAKDDTLASFSSRGPTPDLRIKPDIVAPGVDIISSVPTSNTSVINDPSGYKGLSGTSMATPHVAGAAALLLQYYSGNATPQFVKDALMSSAKDLSYDVYQQGAGRLDLSTLNTTMPAILVSPATRSLGQYSSATTTASANFTFINTGNVSRQVTLSANLTDVFTPTIATPTVPVVPPMPPTSLSNPADSPAAIDYSGNVTLNPASFAIPPGGQVIVNLSVNLIGLPASLYSGKVIATVDNTTSIHAIFGFSKMNQVTIHKTDITGAPAYGHGITILRRNPVVDRNVTTNQSGDVTVYLADGSYELLSYSSVNQTSIWTIAENITVSSDTTIILDERDTKVIDFNPDKPGLIPAAKVSTMYYWNSRYGIGWRSSWYYPQSFMTRISPVSLFDAGLGYNAYPQADYTRDGPGLVNTGEWLNLLYSLDSITGNVTFVADYPNLVHRQTAYGVALNGERAYWYQSSWSPTAWWSSGFSYQMDAPRVRSEWLSPSPAQYSQNYQRALYEPGNAWYFYRWDTYPSGNWSTTFGFHPLSSGVAIGFSWMSPSPNWLYVVGPISRDAANNSFTNQGVGVSGHLKVTQNSDNVVLEEDIWDEFKESVTFTGTANFTVEVWGQTPLALSRASYTRLDFRADPAYDSRPPQLTRLTVPGIDPYGIVPGGRVRLGVMAWDESQINSVNLHYFVGDNGTWMDAGLPTFENGAYVFDLGLLQKTFVTIAVDATDQYGNHIQRVTERAFFVSDLARWVNLHAWNKVVPGSNFTATVDINQVENLDAANYDISFNPAVLRLDSVTAGAIGSGGNWTAVPVDYWNPTGNGTFTIVQNVPGLNGASGSGTLAVLHFSVVGLLGSSSFIILSNGMLSNILAQEIPTNWSGWHIEVSVLPGDANGDGNINALDITKIERIIARLDNPTPGADCNQDGNINALDITCVERKIAHLDDGVPTEWKVAFPSNRDGNYEIYVMNADGSSQVRLTYSANASAKHSPDWSPDGSKIVFDSYWPGDEEIHVMNADGTNQLLITHNTVLDYDPDWSPDGTKIAFVSNRDGFYEIYVMNADGSNQTRVTYSTNGSGNYAPDWSPDGTKIAFMADRPEHSDGTEIYITNTNGSGQTRLTYVSGNDYSPKWSPDGTKLAFSSQHDGNLEIYVMNVNGSNQTRLTYNSVDDSSPTWSPAGSRLAFCSMRDGNWEIYVMNADGSGQTRLTNNVAVDVDPAWKPVP